MVVPYNAPDYPRQQPTMDGFVTDFISEFTHEMGRQPTYEEYSQIMTGYMPAQMPVLSTLARGFATFDHWFCEVPSQTFPNRSFFHSATASGYVLDYPPIDAFPIHNTAETLFNRLEAKGLTWCVYCDAPSPASFTGLMTCILNCGGRVHRIQAQKYTVFRLRTATIDFSENPISGKK
jgi:phospholipase C